MFDYTGWIVRATAGRDREGLFCVLGTDPQGRLLLADGKRRKAACPKSKQLGHTQLVCGEFRHPAIRKLKQGVPVSDRELRRTLAAFKGGNHTWQKTI